MFQLNSLPSDNEIFSFYNSYEHSIKKTRIDELKWKQLVSANDTKRRTNYIARLISKGNVLDYGFGYGFFLNEMSKRGYSATGVEISRLRIESAKNLFPKAFIFNNLDKISDNSQDVITVFHVLEHVTNPVRLLEKLSKKLRKGGFLVLEVPNVDDFLLKFNKAYNKFYWKKAHLSYFNQLSLKWCIEKADLKIRTIRYEQRWDVLNFLNWIIHNVPEEKHKVIKHATYLQYFKWIDNIYKKYLIREKVSDTIITICVPNG